MSISISVLHSIVLVPLGKKIPQRNKQTRKNQPTNQLILFVWLYISGLFCLICSTELPACLIPHFCNFIVSLDIMECHEPHVSSLNIILVVWVLFPFHSHTKMQFVDNLQRQAAVILASWWLLHPFLVACLSAEVCFVPLCPTSEECGPFLIIQIQCTFSLGFFNTASYWGYPHPMGPSTPTLPPYS